MSLIEIRNLNKSYGRKQVINDLTAEMNSGRIVGLLGPNGCGKSTMLKILAGLIADYSGEVKLDGHQPDIHTKSLVSYLPERTYLSNWMRPVDAFEYFADFYSDFDRAKADEMLHFFSLDPKQQIKTMSKGMQEKLQLTLVMSRRARIYLLDEPMGGVDPAARSAILEVVLRNYQDDALMVLATHLIYDVEKIFDEVLMMGFGQVIMQGETDQLRAQYGKSIDDIFREVFRCSAN